MNNLSITLPCKPYVRVFIEQNFGIPVRFNRDKPLMSHIRLILERKNSHNSYRPVNTKIYTDELKFFISSDDYERFGSTLNNSAILVLNQLFEERVKKLMRSWVSTQYIFGKKPHECVYEFQDQFGYPEHIWKFDAIYKYCQRNKVFDKQLRKDISVKVSKITLAQLSAERTLTNLGIKVYEEI